MNKQVSVYMFENHDIVIGERELINVYIESGAIDGCIVRLHFPAILIHQRTNHGPLGFMLEPWVPSELLKVSYVDIDTTKTICQLTLSDAMERFYRNWALAEKEKQSTFTQLFEKQISAIEQSFLKRQKFSKEAQQKNPMAANTALTDAMIELFDAEDSPWGDPTANN